MSEAPFSDLRSVHTLRMIMQALRTPVTGCPWDLEQDFASIAPFTVEEAYEVADAIERRDMGDLCDELGDLLLQVVYHSRMAEEQSSFAFDDVVEAICRKMIRRHPHVFGDADARSGEPVKGFWEAIKQEEEVAKNNALEGERRVLDGVPVALPSLMRAVKLQRRAARVGFDWPDLAPVVDKIEEEIVELKAELASGIEERVHEEIGDLLFAVANLGRHLRIEPEAALHAASLKFTRRFNEVERKLSDKGKSPQTSTLSEMDVLWEEVKQEE